MAKSFDGYVCTAMGDIADGCGGVGRAAGIYCGGRTHRSCEFEFLVIDVDSDGLTAKGVCDHDRGQTDSPAAENGDVLARAGASLIDHCSKGRDKTASETGGGRKLHCIWQTDEIGIGVIDGHVLGKGSPVRKTRLKLTIADLLVAGRALLARSTGANERQGHTVAVTPIFYIATGPDDNTCEFVSRNLG
jgi:hypothetical protein